MAAPAWRGRVGLGMCSSIAACVEEAVGVARRRAPLTHGVPFGPGALWDPNQVRLQDDDGGATQPSEPPASDAHGFQLELLATIAGMHPTYFLPSVHLHNAVVCLLSRSFGAVQWSRCSVDSCAARSRWPAAVACSSVIPQPAISGME